MPDGIYLNNPHRFRAGHNAAPATTNSVFLHHKPTGALELMRLFLGVEGPYGFRWVLKARIISIDDSLRRERHHVHIYTALIESMLKRLLNLISDIALAHGAAYIERHRGHDIGCRLTRKQNTPHLRAVAMNDSNLVVRCRQLCQMLSSLAHDFQLTFGCAIRIFILKSIAPQSDKHFRSIRHRNLPSIQLWPSMVAK